MIVTHSTGVIKKFRRTPWRFQQTVQIPEANDREEFISTITTADKQITEGTVIIDQIVFTTERMTALCPMGSALPLTRETSLSSETAEELRALLIAAFWDGVDFIFIPSPKPFVCYADHDDWITFYTNTTSNLNHIINPLEARGYKLVRDWRREL